MNTERPLDGFRSIKLKLGILVVASVLTATIVSQAGERAGVSAWWTVPVTIAGTLLLAQWLARGMTSPLREMTAAASRMASGDYSSQVTATSADEVGELARAFNVMAADLAATDRQRRELIATVSHELRTPLTAQRALLENLVDGVSQSDAALRTALTQSERLSSLVADLLDLSRVDAGAVPLDIADVDLEALIAQAVSEAEVAATRDIRFTVDLTAVQVSADPGRLSQVLANLLDNAVRHSPAGGTVTLTVAPVGADRWSLEVSDQGDGISPEVASRVFDRFGTGDRAGGTGLGLAIARWVCELHGGSISVVPSPSGARLRAVLPRRPKKKERPMVATTASTGPSPAIPTQPAPALVAPLFGRLWPEDQDVAGLRARPGLVLGSVGIGLLGALLLPHRPTGLALLIVVLAAGTFILRASVNRGRRWSQLCAVVALALSFLVVLRAAEWVSVIALGVAGVLLTTALTDARHLIAMVAGWVSWVLAGVRGLPLLGRSLEAMSRFGSLWPIVRTAALSLAALVVFGGLFASGDALFGSWAATVLPDLAVDGFVERAFVAFVVAGVVLAATYLAINPPKVGALAVPEGRPVRHPWEWLVPVGLVIGLFAAFVTAQAAAMWGGHDYIRRTTGMSYADYVHEGFGQLTVATFLTLLTVALAARKAPRSSPSERAVFRGVIGGLCLLALVVVASALHRMSVYQDAYGYTVLRVLVDAFELWMGLLLVFVIIAGWRLNGRWLPQAALLSGAVFVLAIGVANPEAWVAGQNIDRYHSTGKIDLVYLAGLGDDASPAIASGLPADLAGCVLASGPDRTGRGNDDWLAWNLGRARARELPQLPSDPSCLGHYPASVAGSR